MGEIKELVFNRPISKEDLIEINENAPIKIILKTTKGQSPEILRQLSKEVKIIIRDDTEEAVRQIEYTPSELAEIVSRLDSIDETINPNWTDLEKATYLYVSFMTGIRVDPKADSNIGLKSLLEGRANSELYAILYKELMDRQNIPCRILTGTENHKFNEIMIDGRYYPLDLYLDSELNQELLAKENRFELKNFLSDKEFYYKPEHRLENSKIEEFPSLDHSLIQQAINSVLHDEKREEIIPPPISIKSKELKEILKTDVIEGPESLKEIEEFKINFTDSNIEELTEDLLEVGKYYPYLLDNVTLSNATDSHIDMQDVVDAIYESKSHQPYEITPTKLVIESNNQEDFDLDFSRAPEIRLDNTRMTENTDVIQRISFVNTSGKTMQMPSLKNKVSQAIDAIEIKDFDVAGFNLKEIFVQNQRLRNSLLRNVVRLELSGNGTTGVNDLNGLDNVIGLSINNIPESEFNDLMSIAIGDPTQMDRLYDLKILNQLGLENRSFLSEIKNKNIIKLNIYNSRLNNIDGLDEIKDQLILLSLQSNNLSLDQTKMISSLFRNNPLRRINLYGNQSILNEINNLGDNAISDDTYNYLDNFFARSGYISYRGMRYQRVSQTDINTRKRELIKELLNWDMQNVPYYIEDAQLFRERLPFAFNPMMIKDLATFQNYLNDPSDYFNQTFLRDGTLLLTYEQLNALITSGKQIPQNINLLINSVAELDNTELMRLKQECDRLGINFSGVRVNDQRQLNPSNPEEKVFDGNDTHLAPYDIAEYRKIREALEEIVYNIDDSLSDAEKFAIIYYRISQKIATYDVPAHAEAYSKEHALYQNKLRNSARNLSEGLIPQEGFDLDTNSPDTTIKNRCVCAGYADILKNALAMVGIESVLDNGPTQIDSSNPNNIKYSGLHEWNKVRIDGKWYYADVCWDNGDNVRNNQFNYALRGNSNDYFVHSGRNVNNHLSCIQNGVRNENVEDFPYDQQALRSLFDQIRDGKLPLNYEINIPADPDISIDLDRDRIKSEYQRRKNDMYAKFYGDKNYQAEYDARNTRFRSHEIEITNNGITYKTVEDYPEREEDENFLILGEYKDALERMTKYEAGDTSVYSGDPDQIASALEKDKEYVTTRNHTFNQHEYTQRDLATLGKYGETMPYIPRQTGIIKNIGVGILNTGIFVRNIVAPVYRFVGTHVAQPIHRLITGQRDASPYRNNIYHRMVARRDYFADMARQRDEEETNNRRLSSPNPNNVKAVSHPFRNALEARVRAIFNAREGNEAVLRAGAYDIRQNIEQQEGARALIKTLELKRNALQTQIADLEREFSNHLKAKNVEDAKRAILNKKALLAQITYNLNIFSDGKIADIQTDAVSQEQHAIASKEVNTARVTAIKGVAKGLAVKYVGPKIKNWLLERGKTVQEVEVSVPKEVPDDKWVAPVTESVPKTKVETIFDKSETLQDVMSKNSGKQVSGFYSVWGGERGASTYTLTGNEKITAVFKATENGGFGFSDKAGLTAPTLVDGLFSKDLLDTSGVLNQNISIETLLSGVKSGTIDATSFGDVYLSIGDRYWVKASDILSEATKDITVNTGEFIEKVVKPGYWIKGTKTIEEIVKTTEVVDNPLIKKSVELGGKAMSGIIGLDSVQDIVENLRKTTTDKKSNKKKPRNYNYDDGESEPIPTSKKEYDNER